MDTGREGASLSCSASDEFQNQGFVGNAHDLSVSADPQLSSHLKARALQLLGVWLGRSSGLKSIGAAGQSSDWLLQEVRKIMPTGKRISASDEQVLKPRCCVLQSQTPSTRGVVGHITRRSQEGHQRVHTSVWQSDGNVLMGISLREFETQIFSRHTHSYLVCLGKHQ